MEKIFRKLDRYFVPGFRVAVLDCLKGRWTVTPAAGSIGYLKAENARGRHILIQPVDPACYLLADDLSWSLIELHHRNQGIWKPGRMIVETSPGNFQVWIHSKRALSLAQKRYWLKRLKSDPGADPNNRWGRCPGFRNRKDKYRVNKNHYPMARLLWLDWKSPADIPPTCEQKPEPLQKFLSHLPWRGGVCRGGEEISRSQYERGNESATDFSYALALMRRGHPDERIRQRILAERSIWRNHKGSRRTAEYLDRTIRRARTIIDKT